MLRKAESLVPSSMGTLPTDLARAASRRLEIATATMAFCVFLVSFFMPLVTGKLEEEFATLDRWLPDVINIAVSLGVFALARSPRITPRAAVNIGLVYQVVAASFISMAIYGSFVGALTQWNDWYESLGPGWIAVWMIFFAILVPARPAKALAASLATGATVPLTVELAASRTHSALPHGVAFFEVWVLPYLIVAGAAFVANHVLYRLGADVQRAQELGSYELVERLGEGGMGEVWRARHRMLARPAAIKLIRPDVLAKTTLSEGAWARFTQEAEVTAELQSPHTVNLYDFGVSADGRLYYAMELLEGIDLQTYVERYGPMPQERVVHVLLQACASLHEAHHHGLVHRDIKPSNLVLTRFALEADFVKVLDFGLVKRESELSGEAARVSHSGQITGTPAYLAPELALGEEPDGRADIYALGCTAYWLLAGAKVFEGESAMKLILAHVRDEPTPLSERVSNPPISELEDLVLTCLAKEPRDRPATAAELARRLRRLPLPARWTRKRAESWWREHAVDGRPLADPSHAGEAPVSAAAPTPLAEPPPASSLPTNRAKSRAA